MSAPKFGQAMRKEFLLREGTTYLNHGGYGIVARRVHELKCKKQVEFEERPDHHFRLTYWDDYKENLEATARFLGAEPENLVFVRNTTTGANVVLKSFPFKRGDKILINSWTYKSVKNITTALTKNVGVEVVLFETRIPLTKADILTSLKKALDEHGDTIKLAIIDYISSAPPIRFPWEEMVTLCKLHGVAVLLDAAHTPGQVNVDLRQISETHGVDFFVANLHKWAYTPRGSAVLHVAPRHHDQIEPLITSKFHGEKDLRRRFHYQGTDDFVNYCVVKEALQFLTDQGGVDTITAYTSDLATKASEMLTKAWGTQMLDISPDLEAPNMRMLGFPRLARFPVTPESEALFGDIDEMTKELMLRFLVVGRCMFVQGEPYVRISVNIYNSLEDFERLRDAVLTLKREEEEERGVDGDKE